MSDDVVETKNLVKVFRSRGLLSGHAAVTAVDDVTMVIRRGEALGLVGESGSGKTTIGRLIVRLEHPTSGDVYLRGEPVAAMRSTQRRAYSREVQMIFQNPRASLNPNRSVRNILFDAYRTHDLVPKSDWEAHAGGLLERVGLSGSMLDRYPQAFSSGQCQRVAIARALSVQPSLLIADEAVSALDVSVQAQVLNLLADIRADFGLATLFISHDLRAVYFLCDRIAVLYLGRLVEVAPRRVLVEGPLHPYTRALVGSAPAFRPGHGFNRDVIRGELSDVAAPAGCTFAPRCELWRSLDRPARCLEERPTLRPVGDASVACHFAGEAVPPAVPVALLSRAFVPVDT